MKFVYILTTDTNSSYFYQMYLSIQSLKKYNPNSEVILVTEKETYNFFTIEQKNKLDELSVGIIVENIKDFDDMFSKSRWLKSQLYNYIEDDFLFIDCDTIINSSLIEITNTPFNLAFVLNAHQTDFKKRLKEDIKKRIFFTKIDEDLNFSTSKITRYYNSGVFFCRKTSRNKDFFEMWHKLWLKTSSYGVKVDQVSLNQTNYIFKNFIDELDGTWNCQILRNGARKFYKDAKIIHYYGSDLLNLSKEELQITLPGLVNIYKKIYSEL